MKEKIYDVIIVGAGVAGAILAKTLSNAGKEVLVLEAGTSLHGIDLNGQEAFQVYQGYLDTYYRAEAKVPNSPYPNLPVAPSPDVLDIAPIPKDGGASTEGYFVQAGPNPFASDYTRAPGGTTLHWLGTSLRMLPNDFRMHSEYGVGKDWPIKYDELRPYYEMAEHELGVSGDVIDQCLPNIGPDFYGDYEYPMHGLPQSYLDRQVVKAVAGLRISVSDGAGHMEEKAIRIIPTPQGRNSTPNARYERKRVRWDQRKKKLIWDPLDKGEMFEPTGSTWDSHTGQRCEGNANCVPICPVQAKYNALKTFKSASRERLSIIHRAVACKVEVGEADAQGDRPVTGITYKRYKDPEGCEYELKTARGRRYVLAANSIENAKLLLASGAANSSDQVGRNLMDHVTLLTWGLADVPLYPYRGPGSTSNIVTFRDAAFRSKHAAFIVPLDNWGWNWPRFSPGSDLNTAVDAMKLFGDELRSYIRDTVTKQMFLHFECEQLPECENRVTIDDQYRDKLGNHRPVIHYRISDYLKRAFVTAKKISDELYRYASVSDATSYDTRDACYFNYRGNDYFYRGAGHLVGTHGMGSKREDSVVNPEQRTWDHPNLFLAGCGNMTTLGTSNPTLTMAALTFWLAENILKDLN